MTFQRHYDIATEVGALIAKSGSYLDTDGGFGVMEVAHSTLLKLSVCLSVCLCVSVKLNRDRDASCSLNDAGQYIT